MKVKKIPLRKCISCGENKVKKELIRVVKNKENQVSVDLKGKANGRGTYICKDTSCFEIAYKGKKIDRVLETKIDEDIYNQLKEIIDSK